MDIGLNDLWGCKNYGIFIARASGLEKSLIHRNNFIDNKEHTCFKNCKSKWNDNYWDNSILAYISGIYIVWRICEIGSFGLTISSFQLGVRCAKSPYDI